MACRSALRALVGATVLISVSAQAAPGPGAQSIATVEPAIVLIQSVNQQQLQQYYETEGRRALDQGNRGGFR